VIGPKSSGNSSSFFPRARHRALTWRIVSSGESSPDSHLLMADWLSVLVPVLSGICRANAV